MARAAGLLPFSLAEALVLRQPPSSSRGPRLEAWPASAEARRGWRSVLAAWAANGVLVAGIGYGLFLLLWGFNYARPPLASLARLPVAPRSRS